MKITVVYATVAEPMNGRRGLFVKAEVKFGIPDNQTLVDAIAGTVESHDYDPNGEREIFRPVKTGLVNHQIHCWFYDRL